MSRPTIAARTARPTPTPMPILAPVERPPLDGLEVEVPEAEELVVLADEVEEEVGAAEAMPAWIVMSGDIVMVCRIGALEVEDAATAIGFIVAVTTVWVVVTPRSTMLK